MLEKKKILKLLNEKAKGYLVPILEGEGTTIEKVKKELPIEKRKRIARKINKYIGKQLYQAYLPLCKSISDKLMLTYCIDIIMLEYRQKVWSYEYMAFTRRIGELWETFCKIPIANTKEPNVSIYTPLLFSNIKSSIQSETKNYINSLQIGQDQKEKLNELYDNIWKFLDSEAINLSLDQHVAVKRDGHTVYYDIDYKSGFSSNEKGNTNRLLQVASIYHSLSDKHYPLLFVRQPEAENNHYAERLKNSGLWNAYFGIKTYRKIEDLSGFKLRDWMDQNMQWADDISIEFRDYLEENNLLAKYLTW